MSPREGRQPLEPAPYPTALTHTTTPIYSTSTS